MKSDQCITCEHYFGNLACNAFPAGIPAEILSGKFNHTLPYPGDFGFQWSPSNEVPIPEYLLESVFKDD